MAKETIYSAKLDIEYGFPGDPPAPETIVKLPAVDITPVEIETAELAAA